MIKITRKDDQNRWEARFDFNRDDLAMVKTAKFRWQPDGKFWWTDDEKKVQVLKELIDPPGVSTDLKQEDVETVEIPYPNGIKAREYQLAGTSFMLNRDKSLLADDMGLGKTFQAIGVFNKEQPKRTLVVCPASLCLNWQREFKKFGISVPEIQIPGTKDEVIPTGIVIVNYEKLKKLHPQLSREWWDLVIVDEAHRLKNPKAAVTKHFYGKWNKDPAKRILPVSKRRLLLLTGTPMLSRPSELWNHVRELDPAGLGNDWHHFHMRYCNMRRTRFGIDVSGASNLGELGEKLAKFTIRRTKDEVLTELPEAMHQVIPLEPTPEQKELIWQEMEAVNIHDIDIENPSISMQINLIAKLRQELALSKLPALFDMIEEHLDTGNKLVVAAHHRAVVEAIHDKFKEQSVFLYGGMSPKDKQNSVDLFQENDGIKLFVGSIQAAGVGITLTAASEMIFAENDWTPGSILQMCDRIRRIGQKNACNYKYPVISGSIDEMLLKKWLAKKQIIDTVLG